MNTKYKYRLIFLAFALISGCQKNVSLLPTSSTQDVMAPKVVNACPQNRVVSFAELGLPKDLRLLLLPNTVESSPQVPGRPLSISPENTSPTAIFDDELYDYSVSPDHKWIFFNRRNEANKHLELWISSLDGKKQWPVMELDSASYTGYASWVSEQDIFIIGSPHENDISALDSWEYMPFISVNPFTLEQKQLTYLARNPPDELFYYGTANLENHPFGMYGGLSQVDFLYDYEKDSTIPVFSWLDDMDPFDMQPMSPIWVYDDDKFAVTVGRSDGIDLAFDLDIQSAAEDKPYADVMKRIILPEQLLPSSVLGIVPGEDLLALQRLDFFNTSQGENWFYVLDYNHQIIYDYCFDLKDTVMRVKFSPDGRFAALSLEDLGSILEQHQHYVAILDLKTGLIAYLKGYTLVDWGLSSN